MAAGRESKSTRRTTGTTGMGRDLRFAESKVGQRSGEPSAGDGAEVKSGLRGESPVRVVRGICRWLFL